MGLRQGGNRYYYVFDGLGSVVGLTNSTGALVNTYSYDPYGNILGQTEGVVQPFKFAGVYYDSEYALYKMGARYCDQTTGRFTQPDRLHTAKSTPQHVHRYAYAGNDPANQVDPSGYFGINWSKLAKVGRMFLYAGAIIAGASAMAAGVVILVGVVVEAIACPATLVGSVYVAQGAFAMMWTGYSLLSRGVNGYAEELEDLDDRERYRAPTLPPAMPNPFRP